MRPRDDSPASRTGHEPPEGGTTNGAAQRPALVCSSAFRRNTAPALAGASRLLARSLVALALVVASLTPARAETRDAVTVALGWQTESADAVVVATPLPDASPGDAHEVSFRIDRKIKGDLEPSSTVRVVWDDHGLGRPWRDGLPHLLFLDRSPTDGGAEPSWVPVSGAFSVRPLADGSVEARFPDLVAALGQALATKEPAPLRALLVTWMEDADPGVAWSGATDFVRHEELHAALTDAERARIVAAYVRQPLGKTTKDALAYAVAATRSPAAAPALVESLLLDGAKRIRGAVAEALRRLDAPESEALLTARLREAKPAQQVALLGALAVVGGRDAAPDVRALLDADDPAVRAEAAAALGGMARNVRAKDPDARLGLSDALSAHVLDAETGAPVRPDAELRARLWALAQLDEPAAFYTVRRASASTTLSEPVRAWAERLLARPRQSLVN